MFAEELPTFKHTLRLFYFMIRNLIYDSLKMLIKIIMRIFYPATVIFNKERFKFNRPTIIVSNHPNTLLDAIGTATRVKKRVFFLVNAGLFKHPIANWVLNRFFCIPVMRKKDEGVKKVDNDASFKRAFEHLAKGGNMYIAPEGTSFLEHRLRPIKSGTARIALGAEAANEWQLGVNILPVGLTYSAGNKFRSRLVVNVGTPIVLSEFKADYAVDVFKTVKKVSGLLEESMQNLITHTVDDAEDDFIQKLETLHLTEEKDHKKVFLQTQKNIQNFRAFPNNKRKEWVEQVTQYFQKLKIHKVSDKAVFLNKSKNLQGNIGLRVLVLILGFPFFVYGAINHLLPAGIPAFVNKKANIYIGYHSAIKTMVGLFTLPIFYYWQYKWVGMYFDWPLALVYLLTLYPFGVLAWKYKDFFGLTRELVLFSKLRKKEKEVLVEERRGLK